MTILYDALLEGCGTFTNEMERRAIFVVSDGFDTASSASAVSVRERAAKSNIAIYAVGLANRTTQRGDSVARGQIRRFARLRRIQAAERSRSLSRASSSRSSTLSRANSSRS